MWSENVCYYEAPESCGFRRKFHIAVKKAQYLNNQVLKVVGFTYCGILIYIPKFQAGFEEYAKVIYIKKIQTQKKPAGPFAFNRPNKCKCWCLS